MFYCLKRSHIYKIFLVMLFGVLLFSFFHSIAFAQDSPSRERVAVLFLVDESGGMNRECPGVSYTSVDSPQNGALVLDVDNQEKRRYQIIRFFMALVGSVYDGESGFDSSEYPLLQVGIAQFSNQYKLVYPFTAAENLFKDSFSVDSRDPDLSACYTNYVMALENAARTLEETDADRRILILITDGSFRGSEDRWVAVDSQHNPIRTEVGDVLLNIQESQIRTYAFVLGKSSCGIEDTCGLSAAEHAMRRGDLGKWIEWDNRRQTDYLTLLEGDGKADEVMLSVASIRLSSKTIQEMTPSAKIIGAKETEIPLPSIVNRWTAHIIPFGLCYASDFFEFKGPSNISPVSPERPYPYSELGNYWWRYEQNLQSSPQSGVCQEKTWSTRIKGDVSAYVWYHLRNTDVGNLAPLEIEAPKQIVRNNQQDFEVRVNIPANLMTLHNISCYQMVFQVFDGSSMVMESEPFEMANNLAYEVDLSDSSKFPCSVSDLRVDAVIRQRNSITKELSTYAKVETLFYPEVVESEIEIENFESAPSISEGSITHIITVPIDYAACNANFVPDFELITDTGVTMVDGAPGPNDLRPTIGRDSDRYEIHLITEEERQVYILTLKAWENGKTYCSHGYCTLDIGTGRETTSVSLKSSTPIHYPTHNTK